MKSGKLYYTWIVLGILVMLNLLSARYSWRWDVTQEEQYTLSEATEHLLNTLESPVTVNAYFSDDLPPDFLRARNQFKDLLVEYAARSHGKLVYSFKDPNKSEALEKEVMAQGVRPVMIEVRDKDQKKQQKAYLSAVVGMREDMETIPLLQPGGAMEYALSTAIKKLSSTEKPQLAFIQGHGEPNPSELMQAMAAMQVMYDIQPYHIAGGTVPGPERYPVMLWVRPTDSIPDAHFEFVDEYLSKGGRLLVTYNPVEGDFVNMLAMPSSTEMTEWLATKGMVVSGDVVIDSRCGTITVQQTQGMYTYANNVAFPYLPMLAGIKDHVISGGLESVMLEFPSELTYRGDTTLSFKPILFTSQKSGTQKVPQALDVQKLWSSADYNGSNITLAGSLEGAISGEAYSRMLVIADGNFAINGPREQARQLQPDNVSLFLNSVDWLFDDTGLVGLRTRGAASRPLDPVDANTRLWLKYGNFGLPIVLVIIYGLVRGYRNRIRRRRRERENYTA